MFSNGRATGPEGSHVRIIRGSRNGQTNLLLLKKLVLIFFLYREQTRMDRVQCKGIHMKNSLLFNVEMPECFSIRQLNVPEKLLCSLHPTDSL